MPIVPIPRKAPAQPAQPPLDPVYLHMAAGLMSKEGKLNPAPAPTGNPDRTVLGAPRS